MLDGLLDAGECSALRDEVDALVRQRVLGEQPLVEEVNAKAPAMGLTAAAATRTCTTPVTSSTSAASRAQMQEVQGSLTLSVRDAQRQRADDG